MTPDILERFEEAIACSRIHNYRLVRLMTTKVLLRKLARFVSVPVTDSTLTFTTLTGRRVLVVFDHAVPKGQVWSVIERETYDNR